MPDLFLKELMSSKRVLLTPHEHPDADATGSVLGLAWFLHGLGKEFRIVATPNVPGFLTFLDTQGWIEFYDPVAHGDIASWPDRWVLADANELGRLGPLREKHRASGAIKLCIDHHLPCPDIDLFDFAYTDSDASSTCEMVCRAIGAESGMPLPMAQAIYAGIVDDTGGFRFPSTSPEVLRMAASLLEKGVRPEAVHRGLYNQATPAKMRIAGIALEGMRLFCDERVAVMAASLADMESVGAIHEDLEGLVNKPLELRTVEVSALAYEKPGGKVKISVRSKSVVDVNAICRRFGGGGHRLAAGVTLDGPISSATATVLPAIIAGIEHGVA